MNTSQQSIRVGFFFLLGVALIWVTFATLSGSKLFEDRGYQLIAGFDNLKELKIGDEVRMAGVKIGNVEKTRLKAGGGGAEALLRILSKYQVPSDSKASIIQSGLLGSYYISTSTGTPGGAMLKDGDAIQTEITPDFNSVMKDLGDLGHKLDGALSSLQSSLGGTDGQGGIFQNLNKLIIDNRDKVAATLANLQSISTKIDQGQGTVGKLINDPDLHDQLLAAVDELKGTAAQAKEFIANAQGIVDQVKSGKGTLGAIVYDEQTAANVKASIQNVRDVSDKLAKGEGTLGKLINDDTLYNTAQNTLNKADRAIDGLNDSGPITAVGVVANALF
jgi:phospholipid/cholesterol/gamma-HCH transport system substrate-binding protein